ncbi:MAG: ABC transporter ATP-binding protein, partial [Clostridia bacterium]
MNHSLVRAMVLVWGIGKKWILVSAATRIVLAMLPLTTVWLTKELVNHVMKVISQKQIDVEQSLFLLLLFFLVAGTNHLLSMVMKVNDAKMEQILDYHLTKKVSEKAMAVPLSCYDQSDFFNRLHRMQSSLIGERFLDPLKTAMDIGQSMITLVSFLIFLVHTHWGLTLLSLICMVPILLIQTRFGMMEFFLAKTQTPEIREAHYIHEIVTSRESAKEVRIFQLKHYLLERWSNLYLHNMQ